MPKKKPLVIPNDFVEKVIAIISNESEAGRKKIVSISKRAEAKYDAPVDSWLTGWVYQFTRTRGGEIKQSIKVMEDFSDAYTRLQEFLLVISKGEWKEQASYNYFLFNELINAVPDYDPVDEAIKHKFILQLKDLVINQIESFLAQYKDALEKKKTREMEIQATHQSSRQSIENVLIFNTVAAAKEAQTKQRDKAIFCLELKNTQWHLTWVDSVDEMYPLSLSDELAKILTSLESHDLEKLNSARIKRECIKCRKQYLDKLQLSIDPEDSRTNAVLTNKELSENGVTSTFIFRSKGDEAGLWWINSMGFANEVSLMKYPQLESWLAVNKVSSTEADILHFKSYLLGVKTTQAFSKSKMEKMDSMLSHVLNRKAKQGESDSEEAKKPVTVTHKLNLGLFKDLEKHLMHRGEKIASETQKTSSKPVAKDTDLQAPKKLSQDKYAAVSRIFGQQPKSAEEVPLEISTDNPRL